MASTLRLLKTLTEHRVDFVLVGGMAAAVHGSSVVTDDVDICIRFDLSTLEKLLGALDGLAPRQRMQQGRPPLSTAATYVGWRNLYIVTDAGQLDLLGEITGVGTFEEVARDALHVELGGFSCKVMSLENLIRSKRALGRSKDIEVANQLELLRTRAKKT